MRRGGGDCLRPARSGKWVRAAAERGSCRLGGLGRAAAWPRALTLRAAGSAARTRPLFPGRPRRPVSAPRAVLRRARLGRGLPAACPETAVRERAALCSNDGRRRAARYLGGRVWPLAGRRGWSAPLRTSAGLHLRSPPTCLSSGPCPGRGTVRAGHSAILSMMARRPRSSRAWHFVLSAARRDADTRAVALAGSTPWGYDSDGQHSDSDSDPEYATLPPSIPSAVPVTGESYCDCDGQSEASFCSGLHTAHRGQDCRCGEEDECFDWVWDDLNKSSATLLSCDNRKVSFHVEYSCGTAAIRGTKELGEGQHFWEIKMTSPVYGTDMMVGIGTSDVDLDKYQHTFCSLLGRDEDSWGLSYTGLLHHKGDKTSFSSRFGQGSIIGLHLDTWHGTLTFFKNRTCIGVAATKLQNRKFYPMVCSTAAKSSMKVIRCRASPTSLQYLCCCRLRQLRPDSADTLEGLPLPPGLKQVLRNKLGWVLSMSRREPQAREPTAAAPASPEPRPCQRKRCRRT